MSSRDLCGLPALELARLIRERELGVTEALDAHLARIEAMEPQLGAFAMLQPGRARRAARFLDAAPRRTELPPFFGVPSAIKDTDAVAGTFTRAGSRAYRWLLTPYDSPAVRALRPAGFVNVGKTTTSEFALLPVVEPDIHPPTRNPWDPTRTAGGSSGGAAAAVASGMLPIAHGADGGGSIRIPAALCGLYGFKSSRGLTPHFYKQFETVGLSSAGCLARTVTDSAAYMDILSGRRPGADGSLSAGCQRPVDRALRVRVLWRSGFSAVDPEIEDATKRVAALLEAAGHDVEEGDPIAAEIDEFLPVYGRMAANAPVLSEDSLQSVTRWLRDIGRKYTRQEAASMNAELAQRVIDWFGDADVWIMPTSPVTAPLVNAWTDLDAEPQFRAAAVLGAFTAQFNISGQPAASLPVELSSQGLPIGVQIAAQPGRDLLVLQLSHFLERSSDWIPGRLSQL